MPVEVNTGKSAPQIAYVSFLSVSLRQRSKTKSFFVSDLARAALAVGKNFIAISNPGMTAMVVAVPDFVLSQIMRGRKRRPVPMDRAILRVMTMGIRTMPRKISNPC